MCLSRSYLRDAELPEHCRRSRPPAQARYLPLNDPKSAPAYGRKLLRSVALKYRLLPEATRSASGRPMPWKVPTLCRPGVRLRKPVGARPPRTVASRDAAAGGNAAANVRLPGIAPAAKCRAALSRCALAAAANLAIIGFRSSMNEDGTDTNSLIVANARTIEFRVPQQR